LCHTNEYIRIQKNYNSPKGLNPDTPDFRISRIISKPVGARLALYGKLPQAATPASATINTLPQVAEPISKLKIGLQTKEFSAKNRRKHNENRENRRGVSHAKPRVPWGLAW
jgi:hypothetical protein